jgi:hypothetical protein
MLSFPAAYAETSCCSRQARGCPNRSYDVLEEKNRWVGSLFVVCSLFFAKMVT